MKSTVYKKKKAEKEKFVASKGWFQRFQNHHGFKSVQIRGEVARTDTAAAEDFPVQFKKTTEWKGYRTKQISIYS